MLQMMMLFMNIMLFLRGRRVLGNWKLAFFRKNWFLTDLRVRIIYVTIFLMRRLTKLIGFAKFS